MQFQDAAKSILPYKMSAAGDFMHFQSATKVMLPPELQRGTLYKLRIFVNLLELQRGDPLQIVDFRESVRIAKGGPFTNCGFS